jgi:lipoate-protein ligase A
VRTHPRSIGEAPASVPTAPSPVVWPSRWHTLEQASAEGAALLGLDLALLDLAGRGVATVRTYRWRTPTVSFGRHEAVRSTWDVDGMRAAGWQLVRRPTGGRALLHVEVVTYAVAMPLPRIVPWSAAYAAVNARLLRALHVLGVPATLATEPASPALAPRGAACFAAPSAGELLLHGAKLAGSAVWRTRDAYLQHGSLLVHDRQGELAPYRRPAAAPASTDADAPAVAAGNAALGDVPTRWPVVPLTEARAHALVSEALFAVWPDDGLGPATLAAEHANVVRRAAQRHAAQLDDPCWLWRR